MDQPQVPFAGDQHPVEALAASGTGRAGRAHRQRIWPPIQSSAAGQRELRWCRCQTTATPQLAVTPLNVLEAQCEALFASALQPSDAPTADMAAEAINRTVQKLGIDGCIGRMAQEFGDHPDAAAERMRWARQLIARATRPRAGLGA